MRSVKSMTWEPSLLDPVEVRQCASLATFLFELSEVARASPESLCMLHSLCGSPSFPLLTLNRACLSLPFPLLRVCVLMMMTMTMMMIDERMNRESASVATRSPSCRR